MKRKLLSVVAIAMAMAMTTTAFAAPRERGNGDVDGDGTALTAADLISLINNQGNVSNDAANLNGRKEGGVISASDVLIAYKTILQPNTVKEDLVFNVYTEGLNTDLDLNALHANDLGAGSKANAQGTSIVDRTVTVTPTTTIKDAIDQFIDLATSDSKTLEKINSQLNNIQFHSNVKGEVTLRSNNGWSMLAYALQPIVPMDDADAALCNKTASSADEIAAKKDRYDALKEAKAILVGTQTDDAKQNTTALSASEVIALKNAFYKAIPTTGLTDAEVKATAERVLAITDTKYSVTANDEVLSSGAVEASSTDGFIKNLLAIKEYGKATMADYRNAFGDKLVLSNGNINVVFEVAVVAGIGNDEESTTEATTEATTAEATTEATTAEATTEATTSAMIYVSADLPQGNNDSLMPGLFAGDILSLHGVDASQNHAYVQGDNNAQTNGVNSDGTNIPNTGAFISYTASKDGVFSVYMKTNKNKSSYFLFADGTTAHEPVTAGSSSEYGTYDINMKAGQTVYIYTVNSKACFFGFAFK